MDLVAIAEGVIDRVALRRVAPLVMLLCLVGSRAPASDAKDNSCLARQYKVTAIPLRPAGINRSGEVVGTSASHKAALWSPSGGMREIELLPGFTSAEGVALNNSGQVIGTAINLRTTRRQGFVYSEGKTTALGEGARALALNDTGEIAGESRSGGKGLSGPVIWRNLTPVSLGGCCGGTAVAVNNGGEVVANLYDQQGHYHAFLWDKAKGLRQIGPSRDFTSAILLNDAGDYVLQEFPGGLLLYRGATATHLSLAPKAPSHPRAMNACGAIVGSYGIFADYYRAFAWDEAGGFRDLNELIPAKSGWKLQEATGVNDRGEIVGWGTLNREEDAGFLLTPVD